MCGPLLEAVALPGGTWLEPAAGQGAIVKAVDARRVDVRWRVVELDARFAPDLARAVGKRAVITRSFPDVEPRELHARVSVVITNPPYSIALPVIEHALRFGARFVVMLLRLKLPGVDRPSFSGSGTDSVE